MWQTIKFLTNSHKKGPPRLVTYNYRVITKIKKISSIENDHFTSKIDLIRSKFTTYPDISPIEILQYFIPKNIKYSRKQPW